MNDEERYMFDLMGYVVVEDAITPEHVAELNALLDEYDFWRPADEYPVPVGAVFKDDGKRHVGDTYRWHEAFRRGIANPKILPYLLELVGPTCRLDDDYVILMKTGGAALGLHGGGGDPYQDIAYYRYRNGRMHNGLVVVSYALVDVDPEDGGFVAVPGSHKSNLVFPEHLLDMSAPGPWLHRVPQKAGSAIIFTEALTHGTAPWSGAQERRSLLYKYCPGPLAWLTDYPRAEAVPDAAWTEQQRRLVEPPYSERRTPAFGEG